MSGPSTFDASSFTPLASPLDSASILSALSYSWIQPLIQLGAKRPLEFEDIYAIPQRFQSQLLLNKLSEAWQQEIAIARKNNRNPWLGYALFRTYASNIVLTVFEFIPYLVISLLQPLFVQYILQYISTGTTLFLGISNPFGLTVLLFGLSVICITSFNHSFFMISFVGLYCRTAITTMIFNKSMRISAASKNKHTTGEILTLMSADVERIWQASLFVNWLWSGPLIVIVAMALLIAEMGPSAVASIGTMMLIAYLQKFSGDKAGSLRRTLVKFTDERVKVMNEVLQGIRVVKLYAWEKPVNERIRELRDQEVNTVFLYQFYKMINTAAMYLGPVLVSFSLFIAYTSTGGTMTVPQVYTAYAFLNLLRLPFSLTPQAWSSAAEGIVSLNRVTKFLLLEEFQEVPTLLDSKLSGETSKEEEKVPIVSIRNADFYWESTSEIASGSCKPTLSNINLDIYQGDFIAIVGTVGSGKSSLLSAIIGQMNRSKGTQSLNAKIAYVAQEHWIQNLKLIENIVFGRSINESRYVTSIDASQSSKDLLALPHADYTSIGERGINLSGGQKARVSIARALYSENAELYLIDDALAAVDVHVGKALFNDAINGLLREKTRVVVLSSNYHLLPVFQKIVVMVDGAVAKVGSYDEVAAEFPQYSSETVDGPGADVHSIKSMDSDKALSLPEVEIEGPQDGASASSTSDAVELECVTDSKQESDEPKSHVLVRQVSEFLSNKHVISRKRTESQNLMTTEDREKGAVSSATYVNYFSAAVGSRQGAILFAVVMLLFLISQGVRILSDIWVGLWALQEQSSGSNWTATQNNYYLAVYIVLIGVTLLLVMMRSYSFVQIGIGASRRLHASILKTILAAPINLYYDITPMGRILNRFSKDLDSMDSLLPDFFLQNVQNLSQVLGIVVVCVISTPYIVLLMAPLAVLFYFIQSYFRKSSREMKRLDGVSRSPIYSFFGEVLQGLSTIRAYGRTSEFQDRLFHLVDFHAANFFAYWCASRWLAIRLDFIGVCIIFVVAILAVGLVSAGGVVSTNSLGIAMVYALQLTGLLQWTVRVTIETETNMTSVERLLTFADIQPEANNPTIETYQNFEAFLKSTISRELLKPQLLQHVDELVSKESVWPYFGCIQISNLSMRYRPGLDLVLKDVSINIAGGAKVGICGRTGSGKSSLMLALFRIVEPEPGTVISIDGTNIIDMNLEQLRSYLTIIPQEPVMFSGTLRYNLDPFAKYSDDEIWEAVERAHFKSDIIEKFPNKLSHEVSERGENLSTGQRQLICIARALLRKSKVIVMDEATASVDSVTDGKIQDTIRREFKQCTVLTIAHRLETIADYDKVIVMDQGKVAEQGTPYELLQIEGGMFRGLVDELGPERKEVLTNLAFNRDTNNQQDIPVEVPHKATI